MHSSFTYQGMIWFYTLSSAPGRHGSPLCADCQCKLKIKIAINVLNVSKYVCMSASLCLSIITLSLTTNRSCLLYLSAGPSPCICLSVCLSACLRRSLIYGRLSQRETGFVFIFSIFHFTTTVRVKNEEKIVSVSKR